MVVIQRDLKDITCEEAEDLTEDRARWCQRVDQ